MSDNETVTVPRLSEVYPDLSHCDGDERLCWDEVGKLASAMRDGAEKVPTIRLREGPDGRREMREVLVQRPAGALRRVRHLLAEIEQIAAVR